MPRPTRLQRPIQIVLRVTPEERDTIDEQAMAWAKRHGADLKLSDRPRSAYLRSLIAADADGEVGCGRSKTCETFDRFGECDCMEVG